MATEYGVGVSRNRFELIDMEEDEDPFEILKIREREREARKKKQEEHSDKETKGKETPGVKRGAVKETQKPKEEGRTQRGQGGGERQEGRNERTTRTEESQEDGEQAKIRGGDRRYGGGFQEGMEGRGGGRGRGLGRGGRGGRGAGGRQERSGGYQERSSGRQDRKEETNQSAERSTKRDLVDDWDTPEAAIQGPMETISESKSTELKDQNNTTVEVGEEGGAVPGTGDPMEEEMRELTLDEWKALKKREEPTYNIRKAGEGEDLTKWKNMVALKKERQNQEDGSDEEYEFCEYPQRVGRQKYIKDLNFKFAERRRGAGGGVVRRGRGAERRGPQETESADKTHRSSAPPPKVDDEHDFPSLG